MKTLIQNMSAINSRHCKSYRLQQSPKKHYGWAITKIFLLTFAAACFLSCRGKKTSSEDNNVAIVATSSWTAAYAQAAGAEKVVVLAPFDMPHPSEYELRPGDIPKLMNAKVIILAGYEVMAERLKKEMNLPAEKLLLIDTDYSFESMEKSIMTIATRIDTEIIARKNLSEIRRMLDGGKRAIDEKGMTGSSVVVHRFQSSLARELGLIPIVIFGPASPEALEIVAVSKQEAAFIIDNLHNPVGQPFKEVLQGAHYCQLLNFPGLEGTQSLTDVIRYNISQLTAYGNAAR